MKVESYIQSLPIQEFAGTPEGIAIFADRPALQDAVAAFATTGHEQSLDGYERLGKGKRSEVFAVDDVAVKVSTQTTSERRLPSGRRVPDELVEQFTYMTALNSYLYRRPDYQVSTPKQYVALKIDNGSSLLVQQRMRDIQPLSDWIITHRNPANPWQESDIKHAARRRITAAVGDVTLRLGLSDLYMPFPDILHAGNVLVPQQTDTPTKGPLCIIDQPRRNVHGQSAIRLAAWRLQLLRQSPVVRYQ
ncbi:MAG TPA: hypothetical protein VD735_07480 [Candidatus Saccharimonadales bacterium]|nr:hypothetical protein [Candidatus Saccharimonadales bacterium]